MCKYFAQVVALIVLVLVGVQQSCDPLFFLSSSLVYHVCTSSCTMLFFLRHACQLIPLPPAPCYSSYGMHAILSHFIRQLPPIILFRRPYMNRASQLHNLCLCPRRGFSFPEIHLQANMLCLLAHPADFGTCQ